MPTFRKVEIVDAREFTGDPDNRHALVFWVLSNGGKAEMHWTDDGTINYIRVYKHRESYEFDMAFPGDWIERRQHRSFEVTRKEVIATYEEV